MEISLILAKIIGIYFLIVAIAMYVNPKGFRKMIREVAENSAALTLAGVITLLIGIILVVLHNTWTVNWALPITLLGWLTLLKGAIRLFIPTVTHQLTHMISNNVVHFAVALLALIIGLYFMYFGYVAV